MNFSQIFQDGIDGSLSSRRVITVMAFLLCATAFIANMFFGITIEKFIFDAMSYIAMAGMGATVAEKFSSAERTVINRQYDPQYQLPTVVPRARGTPLPRQEDPLI